MKSFKFLIIIALLICACAPLLAEEEETSDKHEERLTPISDSETEFQKSEEKSTNTEQRKHTNDDKDTTNADIPDIQDRTDDQGTGSVEEVHERATVVKENLSIKENQDSFILEARNSESKNTEVNEKPAHLKSARASDDKSSGESEEIGEQKIGHNDYGNNKVESRQRGSPDENKSEVSDSQRLQGRSGFRDFEETLPEFDISQVTFPHPLIKPELLNPILPQIPARMPSTFPPPLMKQGQLNSMPAQIPSFMTRQLFNPAIHPFTSQKNRMERFKPLHSFEIQHRKASDEQNSESLDSNSYPFALNSRRSFNIIPKLAYATEMAKFTQTPPPSLFPPIHNSFERFERFEPLVASRNKQLNIPDTSRIHMPQLPYFQRIQFA